MNKDDLKKKILSMIKDQRIMNVIAVVIIALFALIVLSFFNKGSSSKLTMFNNSSNQEKSIVKNQDDKVLSTYEDAQRESLRNILQNIKGVGDVQVMMYFEGSESKVPAVDTTDQTSVTEEKDKDSGERVTNQKNSNSKVVMANNGNDPLILKTEKPKVTGIVIVAQGADSSKVKYDITKACAGLYDISMDKINVYPMK
ncbi:stage III sporulation protein AG [Clostridium sp. 'White wine YQ']|uniref:stage III sporulation protein AG n=1 Tax=Clostridium sp. 'White wine YQ' TaxID=3027474 RepID=UPI0023670DF7|nr:stage III sporulation protein AG [Clostridium sp. 'White wine YQ']MDD7793940.1 stage III sporulation protein AG [Clostridium sp. 'White wine YQ']